MSIIFLCFICEPKNKVSVALSGANTFLYDHRLSILVRGSSYTTILTLMQSQLCGAPKKNEEITSEDQQYSARYKLT